jgi:hypothetical protein
MNHEDTMRAFAHEYPAAFGAYIGTVGKTYLGLKDEYGNAQEAMDMAFALTDTPAGFPSANALPTWFEVNLVRLLVGIES